MKKSHKAGAPIILILLSSIAIGYGVDVDKAILMVPGCFMVAVGFLLLIPALIALIDSW